MDVAPRAPKGEFQIYLIDREREGVYPGQVFPTFQAGFEMARTMNATSTSVGVKGQEVHHVFDDEGNNLTFSHFEAYERV